MSRFIRLFSTFALLGLLAGTGAGCVQFRQDVAKAYTTAKNVAAAVSSSKINRKAVTVAALTANGFIQAADLYLQQPPCNGALIVCRNSAATEPLIKAVTSLRSARNNMLDFMRSHPGQLGDGLYDLMVSATNEIQGVFAAYNIKLPGQ